MTMFNDFFELLGDVPIALVLAWVGWFATGALIVMWYRRADDVEATMPAPAARPVSKPKPASRPPSHPDLHAALAAETQAAAEAHAGSSERTKPPVVVGDPFGELATLLDQPGPAVATDYAPPPGAPEAPRAPAESPILSSSGSPIRRANQNGEPGH